MLIDMINRLQKDCPMTITHYEKFKELCPIFKIDNDDGEVKEVHA